MAKKPKAKKRVSVKAWGVFVAGNDVPDETFPIDWRKKNIEKWQRDHEREDYEIRPITITYEQEVRRAK